MKSKKSSTMQGENAGSRKRKTDMLDEIEKREQRRPS